MREMRGLVVVAVLIAAGCNEDRDADRDAAADSAAVEDAAATTALLSPIRAVSLPVVEFAQMAAQRAVNPTIRQYSQTVAVDHRALIATLDSVARLRGTTLTETAEARDLANTVRMAHSGLESLDSVAFDLPFVRAEVESHRLLLDQLDQRLIPGATSADIRLLLTDTRAMVDAHLTRARQLLAEQLGESPDPAAVPAPVGRPRSPSRPDSIR